MQSDSEYDKVILEFDVNMNPNNDNTAVFLDTSKCSFHIDILDSIRNVEYIKIIKSTVIMDNINLNNGDSIYIHMNSYERLRAKYDEDIYAFFETVDININNVVENTTDVLFTKEYTPVFEKHDVSVYKLKPMEPNLKRFDFKLYYKNQSNNMLEIMDTNDIKRFKMLICVYSRHKKF